MARREINKTAFSTQPQTNQLVAALDLGSSPRQNWRSDAVPRRGRFHFHRFERERFGRATCSPTATDADHGSALGGGVERVAQFRSVELRTTPCRSATCRGPALRALAVESRRRAAAFVRVADRQSDDERLARLDVHARLFARLHSIEGHVRGQNAGVGILVLRDKVGDTADIEGKKASLDRSRVAGLSSSIRPGSWRNRRANVARRADQSMAPAPQDFSERMGSRRAVGRAGLQRTRRPIPEGKFALGSTTARSGVREHEQPCRQTTFKRQRHFDKCRRRAIDSRVGPASFSDRRRKERYRLLVGFAYWPPGIREDTPGLRPFG